MRKWIALGLAACMTVSSLTGCGSSKKETEAALPLRVWQRRPL